ncbi:uncharacterized protein LOC114315437 [Camellia sinensis]|uniref:uncharacterized protein LOC114315437 n=1 Tax=Camellia sinensis TaxID=4442 RepID=UPI001035B065|nr:uncharacterized protein LOC114315437 [Camellia sinensis]
MVAQSDIEANHYTLKSCVETMTAVTNLSHRLHNRTSEVHQLNAQLSLLQRMYKDTRAEICALKAENKELNQKATIMFRFGGDTATSSTVGGGGAVVVAAVVVAVLVAAEGISERLLYVGKTAGYHNRTQEEMHELLLSFAEAGATVVRLKGGDPLVFGRGREEMEFLQQQGIQVQVFPGNTVASGIAAKLGIPLTHRGVANSVRFVGFVQAAKRLKTVLR